MKLILICLTALLIAECTGQTSDPPPDSPVVKKDRKPRLRHHKGADGAKPAADCCCCEPKPATLCGQTTERLVNILFDFKKKQFAFPAQRLKKGDAFRLVVTHYNPFLYKVVLDNADSTVATPTDGKLLTFFTDPANTAGLVAGLLSSIPTASAPVPQEVFENAKSLPGEMTFLDTLTELRGIRAIEYKKFIKLKGKTVLTIETDIPATIRKALANEKGYVTSYNQEILNLQTAINKSLFTISRRGASKRLLYPDCNDFDVTPEFIESIYTDLDGAIQSIAAELYSVTNARNQYLVTTSAYRSEIDKLPEFRIQDSLLRLSYDLLIQKVTKMETALSYNTIDDLMSKYETMAQAEPCFRSFPVFVKQDLNKVQLAMLPRFDSTGLPAYKTEFMLPWVQSRVWGISGGIYVSGLHNHNYGIRTNVSGSGGTRDTSYTIVRDRYSKAEFGINALAYTGWQISKTKRAANYAGVAFGAGISVEARPKPRLFLGGSFITGENRRLLLTAGLNGGYRTRMSDVYQEGQAYTAPPDNFTRDILGLSGFFSINYSFL